MHPIQYEPLAYYAGLLRLEGNTVLFREGLRVAALFAGDGQLGAAVEGVPGDAGHAGGNVNTHQVGVPGKGAAANALAARGQGDALQVGVHEGLGFNDA